MSSLSPSTSLRSRTASMRRSLDTDIHKICSDNRYLEATYRSETEQTNLQHGRAHTSVHGFDHHGADPHTAHQKPHGVSAHKERSKALNSVLMPLTQKTCSWVRRACRAHPAASSRPELLDEATDLAPLAHTSTVTQEEARPRACRRLSAKGASPRQWRCQTRGARTTHRTRW